MSGAGRQGNRAKCCASCREAAVTRSCALQARWNVSGLSRQETNASGTWTPRLRTRYTGRPGGRGAEGIPPNHPRGNSIFRRIQAAKNAPTAAAAVPLPWTGAAAKEKIEASSKGDDGAAWITS